MGAAGQQKRVPMGANRRQPTRSGDSLERQTNIGANVPRLARRSPKPLVVGSIPNRPCQRLGSAQMM